MVQGSCGRCLVSQPSVGRTAPWVCHIPQGVLAGQHSAVGMGLCDCCCFCMVCVFGTHLGLSWGPLLKACCCATVHYTLYANSPCSLLLACGDAMQQLAGLLCFSPLWCVKWR
jgi:hypothetical protein